MYSCYSFHVLALVVEGQPLCGLAQHRVWLGSASDVAWPSTEYHKAVGISGVMPEFLLQRISFMP